MKLTLFKSFLINSPIRRLFQKYLEVPTMLKIGGRPNGGNVAEIGCGSGYGLKLIREQFCPKTLHGFEIDERMLKKASSRLALEILEHKIYLHEGDDEFKELQKNHYGSIFFLGSLHYINDWRKALKISVNTLNGGGKIYLGEYYKPTICNYFIKKFFPLSVEAPFTHDELIEELVKNNCKIIGERNIFNLAGMLVVEKKVNDV